VRKSKTSIWIHREKPLPWYTTQLKIKRKDPSTDVRPYTPLILGRIVFLGRFVTPIGAYELKRVMYGWKDKRNKPSFHFGPDYVVEK